MTRKMSSEKGVPSDVSKVRHEPPPGKNKNLKKTHLKERTTSGCFPISRMFLRRGCGYYFDTGASERARLEGLDGKAGAKPEHAAIGCSLVERQKLLADVF